MHAGLVATVAIVCFGFWSIIPIALADESPASDKNMKKAELLSSNNISESDRLNGISIDVPNGYWKRSILDVGRGLIEPDDGLFAFKSEDIGKKFVDAEVNEIVSFIADHSDLNILVGDVYTDKITVDLKGLDWPEGLARIAEIRRLALCRMDDVILITDLNNIDCPLIYAGERLSLNFLDISTRSVFSLLSQFSELPIAICDPVDRKIFIRLKNVRWDQAFDAVLVASEMEVSRINNLLLIRWEDDAFGSCKNFTRI